MLHIWISLLVVDLVKDQFKLEQWKALSMLKLQEILTELNLSLAIKQDQEEVVAPT